MLTWVNNLDRRCLRLGPWRWCCALVCLCGCQQEMAKQPSYRPLQPSSFFADGRSARPQVPGTIARGQLQLDRAFFAGEEDATDEELPDEKAADKASADKSSTPPGAAATTTQPANPPAPRYVQDFPLPMTRQLLERGRERFQIYCAVCHGSLGYGDGIVVQRGFTAPPSYHIDRLRNAPVGYLFSVATKGLGSMPDHAEQISPRDRWAIVGYVRVLQLSQQARLADLPPAEQAAARRALEDHNARP